MDASRRHDVALVRAGNPGPYTLEGTNGWVVGRGPCWIVDPGPLLDEHVAALLAVARERGGAAGVALTHGHADHAQAARAVADGAGGVPVAAMHPALADVVLGDGDRLGPLEAVHVPGHAPDHLAFVTAAGACFAGDAVLGRGSVLVTADLAAYLAALRGLRARGLDAIFPGHGPVVEDADARLEEYVSHRLAREAALLAALRDGLRDADELLDRVWADAPAALRAGAARTLAAHLDKLAAEGRLPEGVRYPSTVR
ncbi:MAG TPA: MBL fold metallo-hydrolase [Solirubrobacteraceae bacterium]|nr:MBL fold metallo-hydrolase [Solirubrobacteraceae bacterium]